VKTMYDVLSAARIDILKAANCGHDITCADEACRTAGHDHEGGEDDWGCGHDCPCVPACAGFAPDTCGAATQIRDLVAHIDSVMGLNPKHAPPQAASPTGDARCPACGSDNTFDDLVRSCSLCATDTVLETVRTPAPSPAETAATTTTRESK